MANVLVVENLKKEFERKKVFENLSFTIQKGKIVGLLGENGIGKSTLMRLLAGIYKKDGGSMKVQEIEVGFDTHGLVSYLPDSVEFYDWMTVDNVIEYYEDMYADFDVKKAYEICNQLKLKIRENVNTLSSGMKERMMIMLTFARKAPLYILDEPIRGVDPLAKDRILKTILANLGEESTVLIATHLVKDVEQLLDEVIIMKDGKILLQESCDQIREKSKKSIEQYYLEVIQNA